MPIDFGEEGAVFHGSCAPDEADALLEWLRRTPAPVVDLGACDDLHTALVQLLLAAPVRLIAAPADRFLAACLPAECQAPSPVAKALPAALSEPVARPAGPASPSRRRPARRGNAAVPALADAEKPTA